MYIYYGRKVLVTSINIQTKNLISKCKVILNKKNIHMQLFSRTTNQSLFQNIFGIQPMTLSPGLIFYYEYGTKNLINKNNKFNINGVLRCPDCGLDFSDHLDYCSNCAEWK